MKTPLQKQIATICPSIAIKTTWENDDFSNSGVFRKGCALHGEDPDDWQQWQSTVSATAIVDGEEITGEAHLGGTWEKYGEDPAKSNPEISGYENQMTAEALGELRGMLNRNGGTFPLPETLDREITAALEFLKSKGVNN